MHKERIVRALPCPGHVFPLSEEPATQRDRMFAMDSIFRIDCRNGLARLAAFLLVAALFSAARPARGQELEAEEAEPERTSPLQSLRGAWADWPPSENFKITIEYRNYSYIEGNNRGDDRNSINEGRLRVEYDRDIGDNMRVYVDALLMADDDEFTHGFVDDFEDDDLRRNNFNFTEAFLDIYFADFDLRLGKQIITWGKADVANPTNNINPTDYSNLLDDEYIGVVAADLNYYWNDWNLQIVGVPGFTPTRFPPVDTRFSLVPPGGIATIEDPLLPFALLVPIEEPVLPSNTTDNIQFGVRLQTTYRGWDFSVSYYDGINDIPAATARLAPTPFPVEIPEAIVPVYHRYRAIGGDFATTFDRWGFHGEAAQLIFDGGLEDDRFQYVLGLDYTKSDILFDHDLFAIIEYVGEEVTSEGTGFSTGTALDRVLVSAVAGNITYEFSDYSKVELRGAADFHKGDDYYIQPQFVHKVTDDFEVTVGLDILGGPSDTFFGQFRDNDRVFVKLKYTF